MNSLRVNLRRLISQRRRFTTLSDQNDAVAKAISAAFRSNASWQAIDDNFPNLDLHEPLVAAVLSDLSGPTTATSALKFFHWSARQKGFRHEARTYALAVDALVGARMNTDAKALVEAALEKSRRGQFGKFAVVDCSNPSNPFVFDLIIQGYAKLRMVEECYDVVCRLERRGFCPSLASFNALLKVAQRSNNGGLMWRVYEHMARVRVYGDSTSVEILIACLCKEGKLLNRVESLERICKKKVSPFVVANSALVFEVFEQGRFEDGVTLLKRMLVKNMVFDSIAYSLILKAKLELGETKIARELFDEMLKRGFRANAFVYTAFIGAYCETGSVEEAERLAREMEEAGFKAYGETHSFLVTGYAKAQRIHDSMVHCERMAEKGFVPSCSAFNEVVKGLCRSGDVAKADSMLTLLMERGFVPNEETYECLVVGYGKRGDDEAVVKLFHEMESKLLSAGFSVFSALVRGFCRAGKLEEAEKYLRVMEERSIEGDFGCLYEMLVSCYVEKGETKKGLWIQEMFLQRAISVIKMRFGGK